MKRVLIVDDNREMAATLAEHLGEHGYEASVESSGSAALVRAKRGSGRQSALEPCYGEYACDAMSLR